MSTVDGQLHIPLVFFIHRRPETTRQVFEAISRLQPTELLVVADGPKTDRSADKERCAATRSIINNIDWDCNLLTNYAEENMGLRKRIISGIDWVFEKVDRAIFLEDDCVPDTTFFKFCALQLDRYVEDPRIMTVSGNNFQQGRRRTDYSYYFSRFNHCWGWATWRRAWQYYDDEMTLWPEVRDGEWLMDILHDPVAVEYWRRIFQSAYDDHIDSWAYRWTFSCWIQSGLTILPSVNLVTNIGFGEDATHTNVLNSKLDVAACGMDFPLKHPPFMIRDERADDFTQHSIFSPPKPSWVTRLRNKIKKEISKWHHQ